MTRLFALVCLLTTAFATTAYARTYECKITQFGEGGGIGDVIILTYDDENRSGFVYDAVIHSVHEVPIPAKYTRRNDYRVNWSWTVKGVKGNRQTLTLSYIARLNEKTGRLSVSVYFHGYDNENNSSGSCELVRN